MTLLRDLIALAGLACIVTGLYLAWPPAAWVVGGAGLVAGAWVHYRADQERRERERMERRERIL